MAHLMTRRSAGLMLGAAALSPLAGRLAQAAQVPEFWHYLGAGGELEAVKGLTAVANQQFPQTPITQRVIPGSSSGLRQQVQVSVIGGNPPATYQSNAGYELAKVAESGRLVQIEDVWSDVNGDAVFSEGIRRVISFGGKHYGIPLSMSIINNVFYNKAVFEKLSLTPPTTMAEFAAVAAKLKANGITPLTSAQGYAWSLYNFYSPLISTVGVDGYWKVARGEIAFNGPEMKEAFKVFRANFADSYNPNWTGAKWSDGCDQMMRGELGMYMVGDWASGYMKARGWTPGQEYDFFAAPGLEKVTIFQADVIVAIKGEQEAVAKNFLRAVASPEGQAIFNKNKGSMAANANTPTDIYDAVGKREFEKMNMGGDYVVVPNLLTILPTGFNQDVGTEVERYAGQRDDAALVGALDMLEEKRQGLLKEGAFTTF